MYFQLDANAKDDEINRLKESVRQLEKSLAEKDKSSSNSQSEVEKLRKSLSASEAKLAQSAAEHDSKMKDLKAQSDRQLKEVEKRLEAEKEEMMEAMALEVEEIEKTKGDEKAQLLAEKEKLDRLCSFLKQTASKQAVALQKLSEGAKQLAKDYKASSAHYRKELTDMGYCHSFPLYL